MEEIYAKVHMSNNIAAACKIVRSYTGFPFVEIKNKLTAGDALLSYDYLNLEELKLMKEILEKLVSLGAKVSVYRKYGEVGMDYLNHTIQSYEGIARDREALDDLMLGDD